MFFVYFDVGPLKHMIHNLLCGSEAECIIHLNTLAAFVFSRQAQPSHNSAALFIPSTNPHIN